MLIINQISQIYKKIKVYVDNEWKGMISKIKENTKYLQIKLNVKEWMFRKNI